MKKISDMTEQHLIELLKERCPEFVIDRYIKRFMDSNFEQLARTNHATMEVFENEAADGVNDIYDFVVSKDGLPVIQVLRDALRSTTVSATPVFITPDKFYIGMPFVIIVNAQSHSQSAANVPVGETSKTISESVRIPAGWDRVVEDIIHFDVLPWHPDIDTQRSKVEEVNGVTTRTLVTKDGKTFIEQLVDLNYNWLSYKIVGGLPVQLECLFRMNSTGFGSGGQIGWQAEFDTTGLSEETVNAIASSIGNFFKAGLQVLAERYGGQ